MVNDKEAVKKAFDRWLTQTAREQECHNDEVIDIVHQHILDCIANNSIC